MTVFFYLSVLPFKPKLFPLHLLICFLLKTKTFSTIRYVLILAHSFVFLCFFIWFFPFSFPVLNNPTHIFFFPERFYHDKTETFSTRFADLLLYQKPKFFPPSFSCTYYVPLPSSYFRHWFFPIMLYSYVNIVFSFFCSLPSCKTETFSTCHSDTFSSQKTETFSTSNYVLILTRSFFFVISGSKSVILCLLLSNHRIFFFSYFLSNLPL